MSALIVQDERTLLLDTEHPDADRCRRELAAFAELERAPAGVHTYRVGDLGLWNARAAGLDAEQIVDVLVRWSRYPVPHALLVHVAETSARFGRVRLLDDERHGLVLVGEADDELNEALEAVGDLLGPAVAEGVRVVRSEHRGELKSRLIASGWPVDDRSTLHPGAPLDVRWAEGVELRDYQRAAIAGFLPSGSGVVVLPCGAGKTLVGVGTVVELGVQTLILAPGVVAARQWRRELLRCTSLDEGQIGEWSGQRKVQGPVTVTTYQTLVTRRGERTPHLESLAAGDWGLVIYDEVHLLPAPVFRATTELQSRRRLGLTATLVREDGREGEVFGLIGPKRFEMGWRQLELDGWIAPARCVEVRVALSSQERAGYARARGSARYPVAAQAAAKDDLVARLVARHPGEPTLVVGHYLEQLHRLGRRLGAPVLDGQTPVAERERRFAQFRAGELDLLVLSRIGSTSIDLPGASVAIQVSGSFGSRQEEAQRLGRVLRPKPDGSRASFYSLVSRDTVDVDVAARRQRFLTEQGYAYEILDGEQIE